MKPFPRRAALVFLATVAFALTASALPAPAQAAPTRHHVSAVGTSAPMSLPAADKPAPRTAPVDFVAGCPARPAPGRYTCYSLHRTGLRPSTAPPEGYGPADLQSAYALPSSSAGAARTVYLIDAYGYPNAESDLQVYRNQFGLPSCTSANGCFKKIDQNGTTIGTGTGPQPDEGWAGETALDLDMVSAVCPLCHVTLIEAYDNGDNLFTAVDRANILGAQYVSMSWGGPEVGIENQLDSSYFNRTGVVYSASSGDSDYAAGVSYPSTSVNAVAVGGTTLQRSSGTRGWAEGVWNDTVRGFGPGSGCSSDIAKQVWQQVVAPAVCAMRAGNDVAAVADPDTGVAVYQLGSPYGDWSISGGTSAAAPIIASVYALAGVPATGDHPASYPYADTGALNDVTVGNNGSCSPSLLCTSAPGWDGPTGLGTPQGVAAFRKPAQAITLTNPGDQVTAVGSSVSLAVSASDVPSRALTLTAVGLPNGLTISSAGVITGVPVATGSSTVEVTATDSTGAKVPAYFSWTIRRPGTFAAVQAGRLLDTRSGIGAAKGKVPAGHEVAVQIAGRGGIPASGVSAVVLNVTATNPDATGWVTVHADGTPVPNASNLNYTVGTTVAGLVVVKLGSNGRVDVFSSAASDVIADVSGYYVAGSVTDAGGFASLTPSRLLDTRSGVGAPAAAVPAGGSVDLQVLGRGGVPASNVGAVVINVTAVTPTGAGWVTVYPDLVGQPGTSNLNFVAGRTVPNLVVVPVSSNGKVRLTVSGAATELLADVAGYYRSGAPQVAGAFGALTPARIFDTRDGRGLGGAPMALAAGATVRVKVTGTGGLPAGGVSAVVLNVTSVGSSAPGWVTLYADGQAKPPTSNLNYGKGQIVANLVIVPVSPAGYIEVSVNGSGDTGLFADVSGYYVSGS